MKEIRLKGKTIVITGASSGAGRSAAVEFAQHQPNLVLASRNLDALEEVANECREFGAQVLTVETDVTDPKAVIELANAANDWHNRLDIWINNAGVLAAGDFDNTPIEVHEQVIKTNLLGYINGAHAVMPFFKAQEHGVLINNISVGGYLAVPYGAGYSASKFGITGFTEALRGELTKWPEIHVCDLYPAFLDTPGIQHAGNYTGKQLKPAPPVYDPKRLAEAMVKVANDPQNSTYVGSTSILLKVSHALFPGLTTRLTGAFMRRYLKKAAPIQSTNGNIFNTVNYGMAPYGGFGIAGKPKAHRKYIAAGLATGLIAGVCLTLFRR